MRKQAVCIQCHERADLVNHTISVLPSDLFDIFIHVDKKSSIRSQIEEAENVRFVPSVDVSWGQFSLVEAELQLLTAAGGEKYSYLHLVSGACFPAMAPRRLFQALGEEKKQYIETNNLMNGASTWSWHGADRYSVWYPQWMIHRPQNAIMRGVRVGYRELIMRTHLFKRKKFPVDTFYGGSGWFTITGEAVEWILAYLRDNPQYIHFFQHGLCQDEVFFSTLIMQSPYAADVTGDSGRYMLWKGETSGGPKTLHPGDAEDIVSSGKLWCRKVKDLETVNAIEMLWENRA